MMLHILYPQQAFFTYSWFKKWYTIKQKKPTSLFTVAKSEKYHNEAIYKLQQKQNICQYQTWLSKPFILLKLWVSLTLFWCIKVIEGTDRTEQERGEKNHRENYKNRCCAKEFWENLRDNHQFFFHFWLEKVRANPQRRFINTVSLNSGGREKYRGISETILPISLKDSQGWTNYGTKSDLVCIREQNN